MSFIRKWFRSNKQPDSISNPKKKQKSSILSWLCASKPQPEYQEVTKLTPISTQESMLGKSLISTSVNNQSKIIKRLSFGYERKQFEQEDLKGQLINIYETQIQKIQDLLGPNGLYGMANSEQPLAQPQQGIWLKIGKKQQINSLCHIKSYYFDKIFIVYDQFGGQFSIQDIIKSQQNVYLKLYQNSSIQTVIDSYQKQFKCHFGFKLMAECFNKLKITVYRTAQNDVWLHFNEQVEPSVYINGFLSQLGFEQQNVEYDKLKQEISTGLTLHQYMDIIDHKEKLQSKYEGQNVAEYIKSKFLQKMSRNGITPRKDSPRTAQKQKSSGSQKDQKCHRYVLSMTANTLPKQRFEQMQPNDHKAQRGYQNGPRVQTPKNDKNSFQEEIFQFNVYKDDKEQEAKRVAISKERKKRSRSQDITVNDLHNADLDDNDFFDKID